MDIGALLAAESGCRPVVAAAVAAPTSHGKGGAGAAPGVEVPPEPWGAARRTVHAHLAGVHGLQTYGIDLDGLRRLHQSEHEYGSEGSGINPAGAQHPANDLAVLAPPVDARPPRASQGGPGRLGSPEDGQPGPQLGQEGPASATASTALSYAQGPSAVLDAASGPCAHCGDVGPDWAGLTLAGEDMGFCSRACLVLYVRRRFMEAQ